MILNKVFRACPTAIAAVMLSAAPCSAAPQEAALIKAAVISEMCLDKGGGATK